MSAYINVYASYSSCVPYKHASSANHFSDCGSSASIIVSEADAYNIGMLNAKSYSRSYYIPIVGEGKSQTTSVKFTLVVPEITAHQLLRSDYRLRAYIKGCQ